MNRELAGSYDMSENHSSSKLDPDKLNQDLSFDSASFSAEFTF